MRKLFFNVATGCSLVVASGVAMAVDCPDGYIIGQRVAEITINGQACHIEEVLVDGNVTITDSPAISMIDVEVNGDVSVTGPEDGSTRASLTRVDSFAGNIDVSGHLAAVVSACITRGDGDTSTTDTGNMTVNNNGAAAVYSNIVNGDLTCTGTPNLDTFFNRVSGTDNCVEAAPPPQDPPPQDPPPQDPPAQDPPPPAS